VPAALSFIPPMELLPVTRLPEGPDWSYEVKLDGYRAQAIRGSRLRFLKHTKGWM
jgi:ATP-dependent DNA ligase